MDSAHFSIVVDMPALHMKHRPTGALPWIERFSNHILDHMFTVPLFFVVHVHIKKRCLEAVDRKSLTPCPPIL